MTAQVAIRALDRRALILERAGTNTTQETQREKLLADAEALRWARAIIGEAEKAGILDDLEANLA